MIVITTPSGHIGSKLAARLIATGKPIRVLARNPKKLSPAVLECADVVVGSSDDPDVLNSALRGAHSLFWTIPPGHVGGRFEPHYVRFAKLLTTTLKHISLDRLVIVSSAGYPAYGAGPIGALHRAEDIYSEIEIPKVILRCGSFAENFLQYKPSIIANAAIALPQPKELPLPICAALDIAETASALLSGPTWHGSRHFPVYGAEDLNGEQIAAKISESLGRSIRYIEISDDDYLSRLRQNGMPTPLADDLLNMHRSIRDGLYQKEMRSPEAAISTNFESWLRDNFI